MIFEKSRWYARFISTHGLDKSRIVREDVTIERENTQQQRNGGNENDQEGNRRDYREQGCRVRIRDWKIPDRLGSTPNKGKNQRHGAFLHKNLLSRNQSQKRRSKVWYFCVNFGYAALFLV